MNHKWTTNKLDRYNINGARLCDAYGCRRHKCLCAVRGGLFCEKHVKELEAIRAHIDPHTGDRKEALSRWEELCFRKVWHQGHAQYASTLWHITTETEDE
jgi:hypothetical protein